MYLNLVFFIFFKSCFCFHDFVVSFIGNIQPKYYIRKNVKSILNSSLNRQLECSICYKDFCTAIEIFKSLLVKDSSRKVEIYGVLARVYLQVRQFVSKILKLQMICSALYSIAIIAHIVLYINVFFISYLFVLTRWVT